MVGKDCGFCFRLAQFDVAGDTAGEILVTYLSHKSFLNFLNRKSLAILVFFASKYSQLSMPSSANPLFGASCVQQGCCELVVVLTKK